MGRVDVGAVVRDVHAYEPARDYRLAVGRRYRDLGGDYEPFFGRGDGAVGNSVIEGGEQFATLDEAAGAEVDAHIEGIDGLVAGVVGQPSPYSHAAEAGEQTGSEGYDYGDGYDLEPPLPQVSPRPSQEQR